MAGLDDRVNELSEKVATVAAKLDAYHDSVISMIEQHSQDDIRHWNELSKKHDDHYARESKLGEYFISLEGQITALDRHTKRNDELLGDHVSSHWRWIVLLVPTILGIAGIAVGFMRK